MSPHIVGNTDHLHPGGVITIAYNGQKATGKAFWQPKPFWASDDVNVLYPKFDLTEGNRIVPPAVVLGGRTTIRVRRQMERRRKWNKQS